MKTRDSMRVSQESVVLFVQVICVFDVPDVYKQNLTCLFFKFCC